jgi:hypothetical protein
MEPLALAVAVPSHVHPAFVALAFKLSCDIGEQLLLN